MYALLMGLFIFLCIVLACFILIQQGKGDMGMGSLGGSSQMLFGGSGGQDFFERATWIMGLLFVFGALGLSVLNSHAIKSSQLQGFSVKKQQPVPAANSGLDTKATSQEVASDVDSESEDIS